MSFSFRTNGNFIDFVHTDNTSLEVENVLKSLHNTSQCVDWSLPEDTTRISFTIDEVKYSNILITDIDFDGTVMNSQDDFEIGITAMFPGLAGGSSSGGGVESVTYSELAAAISGSDLVAGQQYLITDFKTVHYIVDADGTQYVDTIVEGDLEPLIVTATATNKLDAVAKSTTFPQDIIRIDFDEDNWLDDMAFSDHTGAPVIVTGWKGTIYFRHDTLYDNYMGYDFRNCKFRRWKTSVAAWSGATTYGVFDYVTYSNIIYRSLHGSNTNQQPDTQTDNWTPVLNLTLTEYWNASPGSYNSIDSHTDFDDFKTFVEGADSATYEICCRSNYIGSFKDTDTYNNFIPSILSNNVFFLQDQDFYTIYDNVIGPNFCNNTIGKYLYQNTIGPDVGNNQIGELFDSTFIAGGNNRVYQAHNSFFGRSFQNNNIGSGFSYNMVGNQFQSNVVGVDCTQNTFGNGFRQNKMKNGFTMNRAEDNLTSGIDFTAATHVYGAYSCAIGKRLDGTAKISYINNSDAFVVENANA